MKARHIAPGRFIVETTKKPYKAYRATVTADALRIETMAQGREINDPKLAEAVSAAIKAATQETYQ